MKKQSADQTAALEKITADQTAANLNASGDLAKALETLGKSSSNIKLTQPHFSPKNTLEEYLNIKTLKKRLNSL